MHQTLYPKKHYPFLDGFRAYAILWVIFHHVNIFFDLHSIFGPYYVYVYMLAEIGYLGVDIFFVISGFLITGLLVADFDHHIRLKRFYVRRFFKIIPQYLFVIGAALLALSVIPPFDLKYPLLVSYQKGAADWTTNTIESYGNLSSLYSYFLFIQNYVEQIPILAHTWSIAIEEHFYLFYPLLMGLICSLQRKKHLRVPTVICVLIGLILACNIVRYMYVHYFGYFLFQTTLFRIDALMFGCLLRLLEPHLLSIKREFWKFCSPLCFVCGAVIFISFYLDGFDKFSWYSYALAYLASGLLLVSALTGCSGLKFLTENRLMIWIGKNSYGTYLWHYIIIFFFVKIAASWGAAFSVIVYLAVALVMGFLVTITLERYFLNLRKKVAP